MLWDRYFARQSPKEDTIALYTNYTSDESGGYTFAIGNFTEKMEGSSFSSLLPESTYAVFTSRKKGHVKEVVPELWNTIWNWKDKHRRTFTGDFEVYDAESINPDEAQVNIYCCEGLGFWLHLHMQVDFSYCQQPVWSSCEANYFKNGPKKRGRGRNKL